MRYAPVPSRALAAALVGLLALASLAFLAPPAKAGIAVVFREDFESGVIGPLWTSMDNNSAAGLDYWGISSYRNHTGNYSAWSAQVGSQSDTGLDNTAVHQYDDNMQADLTIDLGVSGFTSLTLSFYYWSRAEAGGGDYLEAWYVAGGVGTMIFQNRGSSNWVLASVAVPTNVEQLVVRFTSDGANHGFEGAYVDDVLLTGTEANPPTSTVFVLPTYENSLVFDVPYTASDGVNESGVAYVELWYRDTTAGNFTMYTRPANPLGQWFVSPIRFDAAFASNESYYEFYTIAVDNAQNREAAPVAADATTTIDVTPPTLQITTPTQGQSLGSSTVTATWTSSDTTSGIDHYEVWLDSGAHQNTSDPRLVFQNVADGQHTLHVFAVDKAGNTESATVAFTVGTFPWWLVILAALAFLIILFLIWRRRKEGSVTPPPRPSDAPPVESPTEAPSESEPELMPIPDPPSIDAVPALGPG